MRSGPRPAGETTKGGALPNSLADRTPRAAGLRTIRFVLVAIALGVIINSVAIIVLLNFNAERIAQIQQSRVDAIRASCRDQNERHDVAVGYTLALLAKPRLPPTQKLTPAQERVRRAITVAWVDKLVPRRDCERLVQGSVKTP